MIEVELTYSDVRFCLSIRDDGTGLDTQVLSAGKAGHWGLSGMGERAQKIGAELNIWSNPGAGTEIELTIPPKVAYPHERNVLARSRRIGGLSWLRANFKRILEPGEKQTLPALRDSFRGP